MAEETEDADGILRLRDAEDIRGFELPVRVSHRLPRATMDSVAAGRSTSGSTCPGPTRIAGINQNYAWGQDSWNDFEASMRVLVPGVEVTTSQMPKLFAGQYGSEISALLEAKSDVIHTSFWGGDLEAFISSSRPAQPVREQPGAAHHR